MLRFNDFKRIINHGQGFKPQKVKLNQIHRL